MRRYFLPLLMLTVLFATGCQPKVNVEKEKEAILAVIEEEARGFETMDQDRVYATHLKDNEEMRLELGVYGYRLYEGWNQIDELLGDYMEGNPTPDIHISKENVIIKVNGTSAWLTCDNLVQWGSGDEADGYSNIQINFLEKVKGQWLISFTAYYSKPVEVPGIDESFSGTDGL